MMASEVWSTFNRLSISCYVFRRGRSSGMEADGCLSKSKGVVHRGDETLLNVTMTHLNFE